jgi:hypothetical protein
MSWLPLFLKRPIGENTRTDPDDVIILKRSLERLGHYQRPEWGLHGYTDDQMFKGIREFQKRNGLSVDGVMQPGGETATAMGPLLASVQSEGSGREEPQQEALEPSGRPSERQCDELNRRDTVICNMVSATKGKRAGFCAISQHLYGTEPVYTARPCIVFHL